MDLHPDLIDLLTEFGSSGVEYLIVGVQRYGAPPGLVEQVCTMNAGEFVFFGVPPARVDLLREIPGIDFEQAWTRRKTVVWQGVDVQVLGLDDLLEAKRAAGRPKDLDDVRRLEKFRGPR